MCVLTVLSATHTLHVLVLNLAPTFVEAIFMMLQVVVLFPAPADLLENAQLKQVVMHTRPAPRSVYQPKNLLRMRSLNLTFVGQPSRMHPLIVLSHALRKH